MSSLKSVIITLPKSLVETQGRYAASNIVDSKSNLKFSKSILAMKRNNDTEMRESMMNQLEDTMSGDGEETMKPELWLKGKKRRLDHLTWEEKLQRKKLKNRVAAQTSRDRKKAKLDELEDTVKALRENNEILARECSLLRAQNESLTAESKRLRCEREADNVDKSKTRDIESFCSNCRSRVGCVAPTLGSAVSPINPLPQGGVAQPASSTKAQRKNASIILKIMTLYLLSRNYSANSKETNTSSDSRNSQKAFCEKLPQKWKRALVDQMNRSRSNKIPLKNMTIQKEWWGRHQKMWKPVQPSKA